MAKTLFIEEKVGRTTKFKLDSGDLNVYIDRSLLVLRCILVGDWEDLSSCGSKGQSFSLSVVSHDVYLEFTPHNMSTIVGELGGGAVISSKKCRDTN